MLYDICAEIIAPAIFNNRNYNEEIEHNLISYKIHHFLCGEMPSIRDGPVRSDSARASPTELMPANAESVKSLLTNFMNPLIQHNVYDNYKYVRCCITKSDYFSDLRKNFFGTKSICISKNDDEPNNMSDGFKKCNSFSIHFGEKYKKIFVLSLKNEHNANFTKPETIKQNVNDYIGSKYGVDLIKTCEENQCNEKCVDLMIHINNEIITPKIFGNNEDYVDDNTFFIDIPKYLEEQNLNCVFVSHEAELRYKNNEINYNNND